MACRRRGLHTGCVNYLQESLHDAILQPASFPSPQTARHQILYPAALRAPLLLARPLRNVFLRGGHGSRSMAAATSCDAMSVAEVLWICDAVTRVSHLSLCGSSCGSCVTLPRDTPSGNPYYVWP